MESKTIFMFHILTQVKEIDGALPIDEALGEISRLLTVGLIEVLVNIKFEFLILIVFLVNFTLCIVHCARSLMFLIQKKKN